MSEEWGTWGGRLRTDKLLVLTRADSWIATRFALSPYQQRVIVPATMRAYKLDSLTPDALERLQALLIERGTAYGVC